MSEVSKSVSPQKLSALEAVRDGRVMYGAIYQRMARRAKSGDVDRALRGFLVDGHELYGAEHRTFGALIRAELIRERLEDIETVTVAAVTRESRTISGNIETYDLPERQVPVDPGWRVRVELAQAGREALATVDRPVRGH